MTTAGLVVLLVLALAGVSIYLAILAGALIILVIGVDIDAMQAITVMFGRLNNIVLLAIPLFVLLGQILAYGGSGKALVKMLNAFMGHLPGGPAYALVLACVVVAAMCSSPIAAVAAFGPLMIPIMVNLGYSQTFSVGLLIAGATLSSLIPPNNSAIIYSYIAQPLTLEDLSVDRVWSACIIPGIITVFFICVTILIYTRRGHYQRLPSANWAERWVSIKEGWPVAITPLVVLGPLYADWASPTEVSAIGVVYVIVISLFFYKNLTFKNFWQSCTGTMNVIGALFLIIVAAMLLNIAITYDQVPQNVNDWITDMGLSWWTFIIVVIFIYTIMGMFMDSSAILLISVPILMSSVETLGINPLTYGVFTIIAVNLAATSPPYGIVIFATQSVLNKPYSFVVRSILLFFPAIVLGFILTGFVEPLSTWLPDQL